MAVVEQTTDLAAYPHADRVESNVLVYDADRLRAATATDGGPRRRVRRAGPRADRRPRRRGVRGRVPRPRRDRPGDHGLRRDHRRGGGRGRAAGDHFAAPGPTAGCGTRSRSSRSANPRRSSTTTPTTSSRWSPRPGSARRTRSPRRSTWSGPAAGPGAAPRLPPRLPRRRGGRAVPDPRARALAGAHPPGCGRAQRHAAGERADALPAVLAPVPARLPGLAPRRLQGLLRRAPRPAAAAQGRRRLLQPGPFPRRRVERLRRHPADGQPAQVSSASGGRWSRWTGPGS